MAKNRHFPGTGEYLIHTSRVGTCNQGKCDYKENAPKNPPYPKKPRQSHHVLPVSTLIAYQSMYPAEVVETINAVYKGTKWCANKEPNLIWLPMKGTYTKKENETGTCEKRGPIWDLNLPCHDWDHNCKNGYTDEVISELKRQIWGPIETSMKPNAPCFGAEDLMKAFQDLENEFRDKLVDRGQRKVKSKAGTRAAIENEGTADWWLPFSMATTRVAKSRPVRAFGQRPDARLGFHR